MKALLVLVMLSGCVVSANGVRASQTKSAKGWFCKDEPIVDCRGGCTSESTAWRAYCGRKQYLCKFDEQRYEGTRITSSGENAPVFRSVSCRPEQ